MNQISRTDALLIIVMLIGAFFAGVAWSPGLHDQFDFKNLLELLSYVATIIAALSAVAALTSWRESLRHSERFNSIKILKQRCTELRTYRAFLFAFQNQQLYNAQNSKTPNKEIDDDVEVSRGEWNSSLNNYLTAWDSASLFIEPLDVHLIELHHNTLRSVSHLIPLQVFNEISKFEPGDSISLFHCTRHHIDAVAKTYVDLNCLILKALRNAK